MMNDELGMNMATPYSPLKRLFSLILLFSATGVFAQQKYALVIGNGAYTGTGMSRLANPVNDADDMAAALTDLGFTVDKLIDGSLDQMESAVMRLRSRLSVSKNSYGFLFYAGHGVQSNGVNYLIPVGVNIPSENSLRERTVSVQFMLGELNDAGNELNVVVLDACRDNPFSWARSGSRGLVAVSNQPADSIVVYATSAGSTASDGAGRNGLFTGHLLNNLKIPGLEVAEVFRRTMGDVAQASNNTQRPAVYSQFPGLAYLGRLPSPQSIASVPEQPAPLQPEPRLEPAAISSAPPLQSGIGNFVRVEGGTFSMGSNDGNENETPVHTVTLRSFSIGKYQVTQKEYREIIKKNPSKFKGDNLPVEKVSWKDVINYCNKRSQKEGLTPVYQGKGKNIICDWSANGYRLPTEAEWEYAAKGGNLDEVIFQYSGSDSAGEVAWYSRNSGGSTQPVGLKSPNSLGLYDMSGNVWEWCWDWLGTYADGAQINPAGPSPGVKVMRVIRGGGWNDGGYILGVQTLRSSYRFGALPSNRFKFLGFRLVRNE